MLNRNLYSWFIYSVLIQCVVSGCSDTSKSLGVPAESKQPAASRQSAPLKPPAIPSKTPQAAAVSTHHLFKEAVTPATYELPSGALSVWRQFAARKPALLVFAAHPFLEIIPENKRNELRQLVQTGTPEEIIRRGRLNAPDTVFTPPQAVSAAIETGQLSEIIYVMPTKRKLVDFTLPDFQQKAFNAGFLTPDETRALTLNSGVISGTVRGLPFRVVHPEALPKIDRPVLVHVDLGYFSNLYVNEVKTPVYGLLYSTVIALRDAAYPVLAVTLSYSNQEADLGLESRFLISNLAELLRQPALLEGGTPPNWKMRADALYAGALFSSDTALELSIKAAEVNPNDPAALYLLSLIQLELKQSSAALTTLDKAVALDPGYALAYLDITETWQQHAYNDETVLKLLNKAAQIFPDDPFIRIRIADQLIATNHKKEAIPILKDLLQLPWEATYHPKLPEILQQLLKNASEPSI